MPEGEFLSRIGQTEFYKVSRLQLTDSFLKLISLSVLCESCYDFSQDLEQYADPEAVREWKTLLVSIDSQFEHGSSRFFFSY